MADPAAPVPAFSPIDNVIRLVDEPISLLHESAGPLVKPVKPVDEPTQPD